MVRKQQKKEETKEPVNQEEEVLTLEKLQAMDGRDIYELAVDMGVDVEENMSKEELIEAIVDHHAKDAELIDNPEVDDTEEPDQENEPETVDMIFDSQPEGTLYIGNYKLEIKDHIVKMPREGVELAQSKGLKFKS